MKAALSLAALVVALSLAGCAGHKPEATSMAAPPPTPPSPPAAAAATPAPAPAKSEEAIRIYFDRNQAALDSGGEALADYAARLYREGHPFVMDVVGYTDQQGPEYANLLLSARRAEAVRQALVARGIPADKLQMQAKGQTDPQVAANPGEAQPHNRRVVITWR